MRRDRVVWIDQGWQPVEIGFAPSKKAYDRAMKDHGRKGHPGSEHPETLGCCTLLDGYTGHKPQAIITLADRVDSYQAWQIAGMIAHEALHAWRFCLNTMKEALPASEELEAHAIQHITSQIAEIYYATRGKRKKRRS